MERALARLRFFELTDETRKWISREMEGYARDDNLPAYRRDVPLLHQDWNGLLGPDYPRKTDLRVPLSFLMDRKDDGLVYDNGVFYKVFVAVPEVHRILMAVEGIATDFIAAALEGYDGENEDKTSHNWDKAKMTAHQFAVGVASSLVAGQASG